MQKKSTQVLIFTLRKLFRLRTAEKFLVDREKNIHCLTMPREIFLKDNKLFQKSVREMYKMIGEKIFSTEIPRTV